MPPRKRSFQASSHDHNHRLQLLKESHQVLKEFQQTVSEKTKSITPQELAGAKNILLFKELICHLETFINHVSEDLQATNRLITECPRLCDFFRNQVLYFYSLPLKNIFQSLKTSEPVLSSPIMGLMNYIYHVKLSCHRASGLNSKSSIKNSITLIGQSCEKILTAFGDGIRLHMSNAKHGPKLNQFQVLVGKVFYPFLGEVMLGDQTSGKTPTLSEHVKRALLEAGEALSGGCAQNKELIRDPGTVGPAILSHVISNHTDFISANIALQLAFAVAPALKASKTGGKPTQPTMQARRTREEWFKKIFPASKFGKSFQEEMVPQLGSMSSKQFWTELGEIQAKIVREDYSKARAIPIESGTIEEDPIQFNNLTAPIIKNTVQFNRSSLTWSSLCGNPNLEESTEVTAEICYDAILTMRLETNSPNDCKELTLSIEFTSESRVEGCTPVICYAPANQNFLTILVLKVTSEYAAEIPTILEERGIATCHPTLPPKLDDSDPNNVSGINFVTDLSEAEENIQRETSKLSVSKEPVCIVESAVLLSSGERVASVQREASIQPGHQTASTNILHEKNISTEETPQRSPSPVAFMSESTRDSLATRTPRSLKRKISRIVSPSVTESIPKRLISSKVKSGSKRQRHGMISSPGESKNSLPENPRNADTSTRQAFTSKNIPTQYSQRDAIPKTALVTKYPERTRLRADSPISAPKELDTQIKTTVSKLKLFPEQLIAMRKEKAKKKVASPSHEIPKNRTPSESIDSLEWTGQEIVESYNTEPKFHDNWEDEEVISEVSEKDFCESFDHLPSATAKDILGQSARRGLYHPVISYVSKRSSSVDCKRESTDTKKQKIISPMKMKPVATKAMGDPIEISLSKISSLKKPSQKTGLKGKSVQINAGKRGKLCTSAEPSVLKSTDSNRLQSQESTAHQEASKSPELILASEVAKNLNVQSKKSSDEDQNYHVLVEEADNPSFKHSPPRSMSTVSELLPSSPSQDALDKVVVQKTTLLFDRSRNLNEVTHDLAERSKDIGLDKAGGLSTPLSKVAKKSTPMKQSPAIVIFDEEIGGKLDDSRQNKGKKLRFESPRQDRMHRLAGLRAANQTTCYHKDYSSFKTKASPILQKGNSYALKEKNLISEPLPARLNPLKSALKPQTSSDSLPSFDYKGHLKTPGKEKIRNSPKFDLKRKKYDQVVRDSPSNEKLFDPTVDLAIALPQDDLHEPWKISCAEKDRNTERSSSESPGRFVKGTKSYPATLISRGGNDAADVLQHKKTLSNCMNRLTEMVVTSIRNKKLRIRGVAANTQYAVFNLTNNLMKETVKQSEEIAEAVSLHLSRRQSVYSEYYSKLQDCRKNIEKRLDFLQSGMDERKR